MKIAILPGDGIGPEITAQAVKVLKALGESFELENADVGGAGYAAHGHPLPQGTLALAKAADAVLFGAVGDFKYDSLERSLRPEQAILGLRKELGLFANLRPAILYPELAGASTLKPEVVSGLDILIIRELTGDIYFGKPRGVRECPDGPFKGEREGFDTMAESEAKGVVVAQAADFNGYRNKLAGQVASSTPAQGGESGQSAAGKITAKVEERATPANEAKDQLKLSKATGGEGGAGKIGRAHV